MSSFVSYHWLLAAYPSISYHWLLAAYPSISHHWLLAAYLVLLSFQFLVVISVVYVYRLEDLPLKLCGHQGIPLVSQGVLALYRQCRTTVNISIVTLRWEFSLRDSPELLCGIHNLLRSGTHR